MKKEKMPPRGTGLENGNAGARRGGKPRTDEEREERHEEMTKNPPFGPWKDFDDCMREMRGKYPEENARRVCGALKRDLEKEEFRDGFEDCVRHFLGKKDFHAKEGRTREESARALCAYIGRRAGKIASADYENPNFVKDVSTQFETEDDMQTKISTLVSLLQELSAKVDDLTDKITGEKLPEQIEESVTKTFEKMGYVTVSEPNVPVHNLPITKSDKGLTKEEIAKLPWAEIHKAAAKVKK